MCLEINYFLSHKAKQQKDNTVRKKNKISDKQLITHCRWTVERMKKLIQAWLKHFCRKYVLLTQVIKYTLYQGTLLFSVLSNNYKNILISAQINTRCPSHSAGDMQWFTVILIVQI